jgi:hypothetical protein
MSNTPKDEPPRPVTERDMCLSAEERRLVNIYRQLPVAKQRAVLELLKTTLRNPQDAPPTYYRNPWTRDGWIGPSMDDDNDDARTQHQRALLHDAPQPAPRQPQPGELLMTFEHGQDAYRVELRDFQPYGVEGQIFQNGVLLEGTRFSVRALAERWAEQKRAKILKSR